VALGTHETHLPSASGCVTSPTSFDIDRLGNYSIRSGSQWPGRRATMTNFLKRIASSRGHECANRVQCQNSRYINMGRSHQVSFSSSMTMGRSFGRTRTVTYIRLCCLARCNPATRVQTLLRCMSLPVAHSTIRPGTCDTGPLLRVQRERSCGLSRGNSSSELTRTRPCTVKDKCARFRTAWWIAPRTLS
jgi:hypothetical protein